MLRRSPRLTRALWALLATSLAVPTTLLATAGTAHAATPTVTGIETTVTDTDPMWMFDLVFTFSSPLDCSQPETVYYSLGQDADAVAGVDLGSGITDQFDACAGQSGMPANQTVAHFNIVGSGIDVLVPSGQSAAGAPLFNSDGTPHISHVHVRGGLNPSDKGIGSTVFHPALPTAPIWLALGDGYSSQLYQTPDTCTTTGSCYIQNDAAISWIGKAVEDINFNRIGTNNAVSPWSLTGTVIATDGATSSAVATTQVPLMQPQLAQHVVKRTGNAFGDLSSWNWVSVSAGLVDVGIPAVMQNYATSRFPMATNPTTYPWDPGAAGAAACPDLTTVQTALNGATGAAIIPNLKTMVAGAVAKDAHVHVVQVLYPWLTEPSSPCNTTGAPGNLPNQTVMSNLRAKTNITSDPTLRNMIALDLQDTAKGFGTLPTGTLVGGQRIGSRLWLSRPFGYPYPSQEGVSAMKNVAVALAGAAAADFTPPDVIGTPVEPSVGNGGQWWNTNPVHIVWTASDAGTGLDPTIGTWVPLGSEQSTATQEGTFSYDSPTQACDLATPHNCAIGHVSIGIDVTKPTPVIELDRDPDHTDATGLDWFNVSGGPVTITWTGDDTKYDADGNPLGIDVSGIDTATLSPSVIVDTSGKAQVFNPTIPQTCDNAKNCIAALKATVNTDFVSPTLGHTVTSASSKTATGWYNKPVTVAWNAADAGGSNIDPATAPANSVVSADGVQTLNAQVCDNAGNCTPDTVTVQIDQQAPTAQLVTTATAGATYVMGSVPSVGCGGFDQPTLSGYAGCTVTLSKGVVQPNGSSAWTYTATATDDAGNAATTTMSFTVTGQPQDQTPPVITVPPSPYRVLPGTVNYPVTALDAVDGVIVPTCTPPIGSLPAGTSTVTCTATDKAGNSSTKTFTVLVDNNPPVITVPTDLFRAKGKTSYPVSAVDDIDGVVPATCTPAIGNLPQGYTTVTCTAKDSSGNVATKTFRALLDLTPPVITVPQNFGVIQGSKVTYPVTAVDNIDGVVAVTCTPASNTLPVGVSTVTCTSSDKSGNTSTKTFSVIVGAAIGKAGFVIGDGSAGVGTTGYFWGSQWENHNVQSRSTSHDSFKGYADVVDLTNHKWNTLPGNSSRPPDSVPEYQTVIITNDTHKSGSQIYGSIVGYAIVHVDSSYWRAPGHLGNGQIVASVSL